MRDLGGTTDAKCIMRAGGVAVGVMQAEIILTKVACSVLFRRPFASFCCLDPLLGQDLLGSAEGGGVTACVLVRFLFAAAVLEREMPSFARFSLRVFTPAAAAVSRTKIADEKNMYIFKFCYSSPSDLPYHCFTIQVLLLPFPEPPTQRLSTPSPLLSLII